MGRLDEVSLDELQAQFGEADKKKPAERVLAAIAYKQAAPLFVFALLNNG